MILLARLLVMMARVDWNVDTMFGKDTVLCVLGVLGRFREIKALSIFLKIAFIYHSFLSLLLQELLLVL